MKNSDKIIDSFLLRGTLNPKVWDNYTDTKNAKLKPKIKKGLSKIAVEFIDSLGEDIFVDDVVLMGSLVNYNWSQYSDFDLHIIINFEQFGDVADLVKENFELKTDAFKNKHNIKIYGYDVELYAQDAKDEHYSSGVFSILTDEWVSIPKKENFKLDIPLLKKKIYCWVSKIHSLTHDEENLDYRKIKVLKDKLKTYRKAGLEKKGEFSYENLVFKYLRRSGDIGKLIDSKNQAYDKKLSIENKLNEQTTTSGSTLSTEVEKFVNSNKIVQDLIKMSNDGIKLEKTPGQKLPYSEDVKKIQYVLDYLGFALPEWGVDGKFGDETEKSIKDFQSKNGLNVNGIVDEPVYKELVTSLFLKKFTDKDIDKSKDFKPGKSGQFTYLDLNTPEGYDAYKEICDSYINSRNTNSGISGDMMASSAKKYMSQGYVPPELSLSQMVLEGGLSKKETDKPRKTKNPYNIGNTDSGALKYFNSFQDGIDAYYDLMTRKYLAKGKKPEDLLNNFTNINGQRYASGKEYESTLRSLVKSVNSHSEKILASHNITPSNSI